jgi:hypothetical protein
MTSPWTSGRDLWRFHCIAGTSGGEHRCPTTGASIASLERLVESRDAAAFHSDGDVTMKLRALERGTAKVTQVPVSSRSFDVVQCARH